MKWGGNMRTIWHLSWYHIKKEKGRHCCFGVIMMITALILHSSLMLMKEVASSYDQIFVQLHSANINITTEANQNSLKVQQELLAKKEISEVEVTTGVMLNATIQEFKGTDFEIKMMVYPYVARSLNQLKPIQISSQKQTDGIYLPFYISEFGGYEIGDHIVIDLEGTSHSFEVLGIVEEMQYGNFSSSCIGVYVTKHTFESIADEFPFNQAQNYAIQVHDGVAHDVMTQTFVTWMQTRGISVFHQDYDELRKEARLMVAQLLMVILAVFAGIVLLIGLCLSNFRIKQSIEVNMVNLGVCKAMGMTNRQLMLSEIIPNTVVTGCFASLGCVCSYMLLPVLSSLIVLQAGFSLTLSIEWGVSCITILILVLISGGFAYMAARKIRRLQPIEAIRVEQSSKRPPRNHMPLKTTKGNLQLLLMFKQMVSEFRQTILISCVMIIVSYLVSFSGILFYNGVIESENFTSSMSEETPTVMISTKHDQTEAMITSLRQRSDVANVLAYGTYDATLLDTHTTMFVSESYDKVKNDFCYEGRNPEAPNEIAIGSAFLKQKEYKLHDTVRISYAGYKQEFIITGFLQSVNYQGNVIEITEEGWKRFDDQIVTSLYVYLQDETHTEAFITEIEDLYSTQINQMINMRQVSVAGQNLYRQIFQIVITMIFLISIGMVLLILYVIMKSLIISKKQELGILKAIGYSNRQLMIQLSGGLCVPALFAVVLSIGIDAFTLPLVCDMIFQTMGVVQNHFAYPLGILFLFGLLLWSITVLLTIMQARPIKHISAYALIKES